MSAATGRGRAHNAKHLAGISFDRLTPQRIDRRDKHGRLIWECRCSCGRRAFVSSKSLLRGNTRSCGCLVAEVAVERARRIEGHPVRTPRGRFPTLVDAGAAYGHTPWWIKQRIGRIEGWEDAR